MSKTIEIEQGAQPLQRSRYTRRWLAAAAIVVVMGATGATFRGRNSGSSAQAAVPPPQVTVSVPLKKDVDTQVNFLGQFSAVNKIELRAQVGGTLTEIHFQDGQIVKKGDLLFVIDPRPYEIKLSQAKAQLETATARLSLAKVQRTRADALRRNEFASQETLDQRTSEQASAQAAVEDAQARVRDAELDLEYCRVKAPFSGRIGARQVSVGALIAGSRAGSSPTTLLTMLVSLDPVYLDFDMSESDYFNFSRERRRVQGPLANRVAIELGGQDTETRHGTLDFIDNSLNRSSGTIRARATVPNPDLSITPGAFARLRLTVAPAAPALMVPDVAVLPDQSRHVVMTVAADGTVEPKAVETGDLRGGLRIIRAGLAPTDRVIIDGIVRPGAKVAARDGAINYASSANAQE